MAAFNFVSRFDENARFEVDITGEGGKKHKFSVPLMMFIPDSIFSEYSKFEKANPVAELVKDGKRPASVYFDKLVTLLDIDEAAWFVDNLVFGEKLQLWQEWNERTAVPLGES